MAGRTRTVSANMDSELGKLSPESKVLFDQMQTHFQTEFSKFKAEVTKTFDANKRKISNLENRVNTLETKLAEKDSDLAKMRDDADWADQYERKDMVILSGRAVHDTNEGDVNSLVKDLLKAHLKIDIDPTDINTAHYLAPLQRNSVHGNASAAPKRNIVVKFVRRDVKKMVIKASRGKRPNATFYANESLTPLRRKIHHALRNLRKNEPAIVKGCTTQDGRIYAYTKPVANSQRDQKHHIKNMEELREFSRIFVKKPIDEYLANFSA